MSRLVYDKNDGFIHSYGHPEHVSIAESSNTAELKHREEDDIQDRRVDLVPATKVLADKYEFTVSVSGTRGTLTIATDYRGDLQVVLSPIKPTRNVGEKASVYLARIDTYFDSNANVDISHTQANASHQISLTSHTMKDKIEIKSRVAKQVYEL